MGFVNYKNWMISIVSCNERWMFYVCCQGEDPLSDFYLYETPEEAMTQAKLYVDRQTLRQKLVGTLDTLLEQRVISPYLYVKMVRCLRDD